MAAARSCSAVRSHGGTRGCATVLAESRGQPAEAVAAVPLLNLLTPLFAAAIWRHQRTKAEPARVAVTRPATRPEPRPEEMDSDRIRFR